VGFFESEIFVCVLWKSFEGGLAEEVESFVEVFAVVFCSVSSEPEVVLLELPVKPEDELPDVEEVELAEDAADD